MENKTSVFKAKIKKTLTEITYPLIAIIAAFIVCTLILMFFKKDPIVAYKALFKGSLGTSNNFGETLVQVTPLILTGLSVAFAFRCGLFNIGAEGQFIMGALTAVWVGWGLTGLPPIIHVTVTLIAAAIAGGLWAAIIGWLKVKMGSHEVINSIMMNFIAMYFSNFIVLKVLNVKDKAYSVDIADSAKLWRFSEAFPMFNHARVGLGIVIAIVLAVVAWYILNKTMKGYEVRAVGFNPHGAEYGGINVGKSIIQAMFISGVFAGVAGGIMTCGLQFRVDVMSGFIGYGMDGIAVALVGANNPIGVILSAFMFGVLQKGGPMMQLQGIPKEIVGIIQGIIILFVAANFAKVMHENMKLDKMTRENHKKSEVS